VSLLEKAKEISINPRYELDIDLVCQMVDQTLGSWINVIGSRALDLIRIAFSIGYQRGERAKQAEYNRKPQEDPRTRNEIRQAITYNINHTKNNDVLRNLLKLADILKRKHNDKEYKTITEAEKHKIYIVEDVLHCDNTEYLIQIRTVANTLVREGEEKRWI